MRFRVRGSVCLPRLDVSPGTPSAEIGRPEGGDVYPQVRTDCYVFFGTWRQAPSTIRGPQKGRGPRKKSLLL